MSQLRPKPSFPEPPPQTEHATSRIVDLPMLDIPTRWKPKGSSPMSDRTGPARAAITMNMAVALPRSGTAT